jgi:hypothetical protein
MAKSKSKSASSKSSESATSQGGNTRRGRGNSAPLLDWLSGTPHTLIFAFNPAYNSEENPELDRWHFILPIEDEVVTVRTEFSGYTPKGDLTQMAMAMMANSERALESVVEYPVIEDLRHIKSLHLAVVTS